MKTSIIVTEIISPDRQLVRYHCEIRPVIFVPLLVYNDNFYLNSGAEFAASVVHEYGHPEQPGAPARRGARRRLLLLR